MDTIINLDFSQNEKPTEGEDFYETRKIFANSFNPQKIIISILTWNQVEKTKKCVEYLLKFTSHIEFDLVFFDNNSEDETMEFLKSVEHPNKTIFSANKNMGQAFALNYLISTSKCEYYININNDSYVTENWLDNILACFKSDEKIAFISPMSSNMSNLQDPRLTFNTLEEMQEKARVFNKLDPSKWQERHRLIATISCYRKQIFDLIGIMDSGFIHNFSDDDISLRIARSGYKQILAGDVFIHHDHHYGPENQEKMAKSLREGRSNFAQKYKGIDGWDDSHNYEIQLLHLANYSKEDNNILGVDVKCGTPLYEIRNNFRKNGNLDTSIYAFTSNAKYYNDLLYVCEEDNGVVCDRIDFIAEHYFKECANVILLGEYINLYPKPMKLLETLLSFLKPSGQLLFKLKNVSDLSLFAGMIGQDLKFNDDNTNYVNISNKTLTTCFESFGCSTKIQRIGENIPQNIKQQLEQSFKKNPIVKCKNFEHLYTKEFLFCVTKE